MPHKHGGVTYEWSLATCGWIYLREVGAGKNYLKKWKRRREPYTVHDATRLVVDYLGEGQSAVHAAAPADALARHGTTGELAWYTLQQKSPRGCKLSTGVKLILVNAMVRLPNVIFAGRSVGKAPRTSRSGLHMLEDDMHNLLVSSV